MTYLLRLVACLFLCVSLNSFGALYGVNWRGVHTIDLITGENTLLDGGFTTSGDGIDLAPVPLPAAFWLFASGLISLRLFKR